MLKFLNACAAAALLLASSVAHADDYPSKIVTIIVPQAPGGGNDAMARILGEKMGRILGQQFVVENRPGAGGTLGTRQIARSAPDGYTIGMGSTGTLAIAPTAFKNPGYDPRKDFAPIGMLGRSALMLVVGPAVKVNSTQELIAFGKANPGALTYGSGGVGSGNHLAGALFAEMAGIKMTHVPFKGANPAIQDVLGGHVSMIFSSLPPVIGMIKGGALRVFGAGTLTRSPTLPEVPTIDESALKGYEALQVYGLIAPAGTPKPIVDKLNAALREALKSPDVIERIAADGAIPSASSPEEYMKDIDAEESKWSKVVKEAGAQQD